MKTSKIFEPTRDEIIALIRDYPLATVFSMDGLSPVATPLPLMFDTTKEGDILIGHFARSNPHVAALRQSSRALAVFTGPHGYISPSWMADVTQAPTWNFATCHMTLDITLDETPEAVEASVNRLTAFMEQGRPYAWTPDKMGGRYSKLVKGVIAFTARIISTKAKFKLGQNERPDVFEDIMTGLEGENNPSLMEAMRSLS